MRVLKFRAFDKTKQKWINETNKNGFHIIGEHTMFDILNQYKIENFSDILIEQFTGLKDKNDIDIYEGDILSDWTETDDGKIQSFCHVFWNEFTGSYHLDNSFSQDKTSSTELWQELNDFKYEVMGNIHENPELLNNLI